MDESTVRAALRDYMVAELLEGNDADFDAETPLLEWGLLNSMEMVRLLRFIEERFGAVVPAHAVTPGHFRTLNSVTQLVLPYLQRESNHQ